MTEGATISTILWLFAAFEGVDMHAESSIEKTAESEERPDEVVEESVLTEMRLHGGVESIAERRETEA